MKKFFLIQASIDMPSVEDDGIDAGLWFGLASPKLYDTKEEAQKAQKEFAEQTLADLRECYGLDDEDCDSYTEGDIEDYTETTGEVDVVFYDTDSGNELNRTTIKIEEVEF